MSTSAIAPNLALYRLTVEYLKKAETHFKAVATPETMPDWKKAGDFRVKVEVPDTAGAAVFRALITMWVTPKKG